MMWQALWYILIYHLMHKSTPPPLNESFRFIGKIHTHIYTSWNASLDSGSSGIYHKEQGKFTTRELEEIEEVEGLADAKGAVEAEGLVDAEDAVEAKGLADADGTVEVKVRAEKEVEDGAGG